jgi:hypothetical protein
MKGIEIDYSESTVFKEPTEKLVKVVKQLSEDVRYISIDLIRMKLVVMVEARKDG